MACASTLEVMLSTAPCSVCDIIDIVAFWWFVQISSAGNGNWLSFFFER